MTIIYLEKMNGEDMSHEDSYAKRRFTRTLDLLCVLVGDNFLPGEEEWTYGYDE